MELLPTWPAPRTTRRYLCSSIAILNGCSIVQYMQDQTLLQRSATMCLFQVERRTNEALGVFLYLEWRILFLKLYKIYEWCGPERTLRPNLKESTKHCWSWMLAKRNCSYICLCGKCQNVFREHCRSVSDKKTLICFVLVITRHRIIKDFNAGHACSERRWNFWNDPTNWIRREKEDRLRRGGCGREKRIKYLKWHE